MTVVYKPGHRAKCSHLLSRGGEELNMDENNSNKQIPGTKV